ncbi:MAG TPA: hydrophobe/amphiphile efflux-1 family RND transporter [Lentisphaeria bacterium]|nr:MAG: hypothetical protein A2X47_09455 [Lentisphaerae bacterium GWF2_38_69]HBM17103.1 hydrophobe/amphiphile efflux-1 family RND transporter [Lentisphaeria bacterium]
MFSQLFINRPKLAIAISLLIIIGGILAMMNLPMAQFPDVLPPIVEVRTTYPGADAIMLEQTVMQPLEQQINGVEDMIYMVVQGSDQNLLYGEISFEVGSDPDLDTVNTLIRTQIALPQLPPEVQYEGLIVFQKSTDILLLVTLTTKNGEFDDLFLSNYAYLNLYDRLSRINGVGEVIIRGARNYAVRIWVDPVKMASYKITAQELLSTVQVQGTQVPGGMLGGPPSIVKQQMEYTLLVQALPSNKEQYEEMIIRATPDGSIIRVKDVAKVELGSSQYFDYCLADDKPASNIAIYIDGDANALAVADQVYQLLEERKPYFPKGIEGVIWYDTTLFVRVALQEIYNTLITAIILVVVVVFIFLQNWRMALVPTIAIPVSLLGTFAAMYLFDCGINTISMFGLVLAIGIVVDDAIVVTENVASVMEKEKVSPKEAASRTMKTITGPVIATTLVLAVAFLPLGFLPGITGQIFRQFAITIAASVIISAINALTLSPALCVILLKEADPNRKKNFFFRGFEKCFSFITRSYIGTLKVVLRKTIFTVLFFAVILVGVIFSYTRIPTGFLPTEDQGIIYVDVQLPSSASLVRTRGVIDKVYKILKETKGIAHVLAEPGYSMLNFANADNLGHMFVVLEPWSKRTDPSLGQGAIRARLAETLAKEVPEAFCFVFVRPPIAGLGQTGGFQFEIEQEIGNHPIRLNEVLQNFMTEAKKQPELTGIYSNYMLIPKINVDVNIAKCLKLGVPLQEVFNYLTIYISSKYINQFFTLGKIFQVIVQGVPGQRSTLEDIGNIYALTIKGDLIPLSTLVNVTRTLAPNIVFHYNMYANAEVQGMPAPGYSSGQAIKAMERVAKDVFPEGFQYEWTGTYYEEIKAGSLVLLIFAVSLVVMFLFLVGKYESWSIPFSVMLSVPVALTGSIFGLFITGLANNLFVRVGIVLIFGMAAKTAILIVEFAEVHYQNGKSIYDAALLASEERFRAIIMTALAFILGVFPLVIATGAGAVSSRCLGTTVFGGMIAGAILGTLLVPCFYVIIKKLVERTCGKPKTETET